MKKIKIYLIMKLYIISCGYNYQDYIQTCIDYVFMQKFTNFFWIIVDDKSTDNSVNIIKKNIKKKKNVQLIVNSEKKNKMFNFLHAINQSNIENNDIIVWLDSDDRFYDKNTLQKIYNEYIENPDLLLTYGQYITNIGIPKLWSGLNSSRSIEYDKYFYRKQNFNLQTHTRTFKYKLFKEVDNILLIDKRNGKYYNESIDVALMLPMLEMCGFGRIKALPYPTYVYNIDNTISFHNLNRNKQKNTEKYIRKMEPLDIKFHSTSNSINIGKKDNLEFKKKIKSEKKKIIKLAFSNIKNNNLKSYINKTKKLALLTWNFRKDYLKYLFHKK